MDYNYNSELSELSLANTLRRGYPRPAPVPGYHLILTGGEEELPSVDVLSLPVLVVVRCEVIFTAVTAGQAGPQLEPGGARGCPAAAKLLTSNLLSVLGAEENKEPDQQDH